LKIVQGEKLQQSVLQGFIRFRRRRRLDQIQNLVGGLLIEGRDAIIELREADGHSLERELGLDLNEPGFCGIWPKGGNLH